MKRLKITAELKSSPIITNELYFDGILYYCARKKQQGKNYYNLQRFKRQKLKKVKLPIQRKGQVYLASKACYKVLSKTINRWRKRWTELGTVKWCESKRVYTNQKVTKNYDAPVEVSHLKNNKIWWYAIGEKEKIEELLKEEIGIGKEIGQGYGLVKKWTVEESDHKGVRIFPVQKKEGLKQDEIIKYESCHPPYGGTPRKECVIRKF